jgi:hypothetical protein
MAPLALGHAFTAKDLF